MQQVAQTHPARQGLRLEPRRGFYFLWGGKTGMQKVILKEMDIGKLKPARYNPRKNLQPGDTEYEALKKSIERWDLVAQEDRYYECRKS